MNAKGHKYPTRFLRSIWKIEMCIKGKGVISFTTPAFPTDGESNYDGERNQLDSPLVEKLTSSSYTILNPTPATQTSRFLYR